MHKEGYFVHRHDRYGQTVRSRGFVGTEPWIATNIQKLKLDSEIGRRLRDELYRSNVELRAVLSFGGVMTYFGDILSIGIGDVSDTKFMSSLHEKGIEKCSAKKTEELLGKPFPVGLPISRQARILFYTPQLDTRLSYTTSRGQSLSFQIDGNKSFDGALYSLESHIGSGLYSVRLPKGISISDGTYLDQILAEACLKRGGGFVPRSL